jgi:hypothetical protein
MAENKTILVVDDDPELTDGLRMVLESRVTGSSRRATASRGSSKFTISDPIS